MNPLHRGLLIGGAISLVAYTLLGVAWYVYGDETVPGMCWEAVSPRASTGATFENRAGCERAKIAAIVEVCEKVGVEMGPKYRGTCYTASVDQITCVPVPCKQAAIPSPSTTTTLPVRKGFYL